MKEKLVIIGNGIAGITLALEAQKLSKKFEISVISGESELHYSRPALMYIFMGHMRLHDTQPYPKSFWRRQNIKLQKAWVREIDMPNKTLRLDDETEIPYDKLVIATGSKPNKFGWPGQDLIGVQGLYSLQDLDLLEANCKNAKRAVIVGGGLIGIELAEMLLQRGIHLTFLVREKSYWNRVLPAEEAEMINRIIRHEGIDLVLSTNLKEIHDDGSGRCAGVTTEFGDRIDCDLVGLTAGVGPNKLLAEQAGIETNRGIICNQFFETRVQNIYAIGDCAEIHEDNGTSALDQLWYTGKMQGTQLAKNLSGEEKFPYKKPLFYNSAKFFDLEYQVYGSVPVETGEDGIRHYYWEAQNGLKSLRLVTENNKLVGVNLMGIRYRHRSCEEWIQQGLTIDAVLDRLPEANFDPEFYKRHESQISGAFRAQL